MIIYAPVCHLYHTADELSYRASLYRMRSLTIECVLYYGKLFFSMYYYLLYGRHNNVFPEIRMCFLTLECVPLD